MYGIMRRKKTTIYLPDELKKAVEQVAEHERTSEAMVIRDAIQTAVDARRVPEPRIPLVATGLGAPDIAERVDEILDEGFGR
jgi:Arc/MetJ-type ribon-helix-helix transcriptional regulator